MVVQFAKWGNSIAVRIPAAFLKDIGASEGQCADISIKEGKLVITPVEGPVYDLDELLAAWPEGERDEETDWGAPVGNEVW